MQTLLDCKSSFLLDHVEARAAIFGLRRCAFAAQQQKVAYWTVV
jgi:hypothetical protein